MKLRIGIGLLVFGVIVVTALAQTNAGGSSKWEVLPSWGQLPEGGNWGAPSQVATTPEGQIVILRRMVPSFFVFNPDGTLARTLYLGRTQGACGAIAQTKRRKLFPFAPRAGRWLLQFDTASSYRSTARPRIVRAVTVKH